MPTQRFPNATVVATRHPPLDSSMYLEELDLPEAIREIIRKGWCWYAVELGGELRTVSAQMLDERSDEELLTISGLTRHHLKLIRQAVARDPGVITNLYPNVTRNEVLPFLRGAFGERVEQRFDPASGRPVRPVQQVAAFPIEANGA